MTSPLPPVIPISNPQPTTAASSAQSQSPVAAPALRALITNISENLRNGFSHRRPWAELTDRSSFSKPESFSEATLRIRKNYSYFRVNYLTILAVVLAFSLITNPFSLFMLIGLLASWIFLYVFRPSDQPLVIFGRTLNDRDTLGVLIVFSVFVVFLTSVGSVLISALMVGAALVCAHGAFRSPEDLFLDGQEPSANTGFLSLLGSSAPNAAANAAPAVAARV